MSGSSAHDTGKPTQRCCLGLLYYSQALEEEGKRPVCLGIPHTPTERVHIEENREADQARDFKFLCLGHSLYERHPATTSEGAAVDGSIKRTLPYCEGLEADCQMVRNAGMKPYNDASCNTSGSRAILLSSASLRRFLKIANRNWDRMKTTAGQAYSMTLKPLIDKLSGDQ
eukprot:gene12524-12657_t